MLLDIAINDAILELEVFIVDIKQEIIEKGGNMLGHPEFAPITEKWRKYKERKGYDERPMIMTGDMKNSLFCICTYSNGKLDIDLTSPMDYSDIQLTDGKNWNFLDITQEELLFYADYFAHLIKRNYDRELQYATQ